MKVIKHDGQHQSDAFVYLAVGCFLDAGRTDVTAENWNAAEHGVPAVLHEAVTRHGAHVADAVVAWMLDQGPDLVSQSDAPWALEWAHEAYKGKWDDREDWARNIVGDELHRIIIDYNVDLVEKIDWDDVAEDIEGSDEVIFVPVPGDNWEKYVFDGPSFNDPENVRAEWELSRDVRNTVERLVIRGSGPNGVQDKLVEEQSEMLSTILIMWRVLLEQPTRYTLSDWVRAGHLPNIGISMHSSTFTIVDPEAS